MRRPLTKAALVAAAGVTAKIFWDELPALRRYLRMRQM